MLRSLRNAKLRRLLMLGSAIATFLLILIQAFLLETGAIGERVREISKDNISNIVALILTSGLAIGFYHVFVKEEESLNEISILDPQASRAKHAEMVKTTSFWFSEGHISRWVRENVLPNFAQAAESGFQIHEVKIAIIDPRLEDLCSINAARRRAQYSRREAGWDLQKVQAEICATVLVSIFYRANYDRLRFDLYLKPESEPMRLDICASAAYLTLDDALAPAISIEPTSKQYLALLTHFQEYSRIRPKTVQLDIEAAAAELRRLHGESLMPVSSYYEVVKAAGLDFALLRDSNFGLSVLSCSKVLRGARQ